MNSSNKKTPLNGVLYKINNNDTFRDSEKIMYFEQLCYNKENEKTIPGWRGWNYLHRPSSQRWRDFISNEIQVSSKDPLWKVCDLVDVHHAVMLHLDTMTFFLIDVWCLAEY